LYKNKQDVIINIYITCCLSRNVHQVAISYIKRFECRKYIERYISL
jgi:hypothetical protein